MFGAYANAVTPHGLVAFWNGVVAPAAATASLMGSGPASSALVSVGGSTAVPLVPDNMAHTATHISFYEEGAQPQTISEEEVRDITLYCLEFRWFQILHHISCMITGTLHYVISKCDS